MKSEYIISDFAKAVQEKDRLAAKSHPDRWEAVPYETADVSGTLLIASEMTNPTPVTVCPALDGWYRIYVCMLNAGGEYICLHLTGDEFSSTVGAGKISRYTMWTPSEKAEESFWKCADMTGKSLEISKPATGIPYTANILWLRFVPMTDEEVQAYQKRRDDLSRKTMFAHMDGDFHGRDHAQTDDDYCKALYAMKDSDVGIVCQEVINDLIDYSTFEESYAPRNAAYGQPRMDYCRRLSENRETVYPKEIAYAHKHHMKLFAGHRMSLSEFAFPLEQPIFTLPFVAEHPELRCKARDGRWIDFLSYGYTETQDFMIGNILESARYGFDGVHLIFNRGLSLGFEAPVAERYRSKYGSAEDFYRLPQNDPKMTAVRTEIIAEFLGRLRNALAEYAFQNKKEPMKVYITAYYTEEDSLFDGLDMEYFAKNGLIDGFVQTKMRVWEEYEDVLADDGLIDLEKYVAKANTEYVIKREHSSNMERMVSGVARYREISDRFGVDFYTEIQWENATTPEAYVKVTKAIYEQGGKAIALWDCYPVRVCNLAEWSATAYLGDSAEAINAPTDSESYHKIIKILSYNGKDVRYYSPSWRG